MSSSHHAPSRRLVYTLLDRFLADDAEPFDAFDEQAYLRSIQHDLQCLLNTRQIRADEELQEWDHARHSLLTYGLKEIHSGLRVNDSLRQRMAQLMVSAIRQFEPRLLQVRISRLEDLEGRAGELRFQVEALARLEPRPIRVVFDTALDLDRQVWICKLEGEL